MFKNLFKIHKPPPLGRWSVDTTTAATRAALANSDNCGTCTPVRQSAMLLAGDDIIDLRGAMLSGAYYLPGRPVSDKNMRGSL